MTRKPIVRCLCALATAAAVSLAVAACRQSPPALRLGINLWPGYEFLYLAQEKGFYRDEGLNLHVVEFSDLSDARRAYERGQIDAIATTVIEVLQIRDKSSRSPQIVQVVDYSNGADVILARPGITNCAQLREARVAIEPASLGGYVLGRGLEKAGMRIADVKPVLMDQISMLEAFHKGEIDAVVAYPPLSIALLRDGAANKIFSTQEIPGEVLDVIAVEAEIAAQRPAEVAALLRAYDKAIAYTRQNPAEAVRIMADRENVTPEEFDELLTSGVQLLSEADQGDYLRPGGKLAAVIDTSERLLRHSGQLHNTGRSDDVFTTAFVDTRPPR